MVGHWVHFGGGLVCKQYRLHITHTQENVGAMRVLFFGLVDIDAKDHATPSATGEAEISKIEQTHDDITAMTNKIGTLEFNQILLDGSYRFPDIANGQVGWWSGACRVPNGVLIFRKFWSSFFRKLNLR